MKILLAALGLIILSYGVLAVAVLLDLPAAVSAIGEGKT
jgi:hypothetical protein